MSPLYQLFSSALPRKIVGTLGTIKVLLPSYPVNKCILLHRCQWNIEKVKSLFYPGKKKSSFHCDIKAPTSSQSKISPWLKWEKTIQVMSYPFVFLNNKKKLLLRNSLQTFYAIFLIKRTVLNVKTDIITSIAENPIGRTAILVIMYVDTRKSVVIVFISNLIICLTS